MLPVRVFGNDGLLTILTKASSVCTVVNGELRRALSEAKMNERQLAEAIGADPATVSRWVSDERRLPHLRLRLAASDVLGVDDVTLWPNGARSALKVGPDREVHTVYPTRSAIPRSLWQTLIAAAEKDLVFAGYTNYFLWLEIPGLAATLRNKAEAGVSVRFLLGDPGSETTRARQAAEGAPISLTARIAVTLAELEKLRDAGVQARFSDYMGMSVFRFGNDMIVSGGPVQAMGHDAPALHLRQRQSDGIFAAYAGHLETLWQGATAVWR